MAGRSMKIQEAAPAATDIERAMVVVHAMRVQVGSPSAHGTKRDVSRRASW
jgi:hypothetical protein